jgi:hypothetical protein
MSFNYAEWYRSAWVWIYGLNRQEWFVVLIVTLALGMLCLRGFGSRSNY